MRNADLLIGVPLVLICVVFVHRWKGWSRARDLLEFGGAFALLGGAVGWREGEIGQAIWYAFATGLTATLTYWVTVPRVEQHEDDPRNPLGSADPVMRNPLLGRGRVIIAGVAGTLMLGALIIALSSEDTLGWILLIISALLAVIGFAISFVAFRNVRRLNDGSSTG